MNLVYRDGIQEVLEQALNDNRRIRTIFNDIQDYHPPTAAHSYRVAYASTFLGMRQGWNEEANILLAQAGLMHDTGKLEIQLYILNKAAPLTPDEREIIEQHPRRGFNLLEGFAMEIRCAAIGHHESQTNAYPRKKNEGVENDRRSTKYRAIIEKIAAADMFDALMHPRAYKRALDPQEVEQIMEIQFTGPASYRITLLHPQIKAA